MEGWRNAWVRTRHQRRILDTPPLRTAKPGGPVEVRVLTWRRDWMNLIWALKSFYHFADVDYPLYIHDGGLVENQAERLLAHFPDAVFVPSKEADAFVIAELDRRGLRRCLEYRKRNPSTRKLFDYFLMTRAESMVCIDSDIVFFRRPDLLLAPPEGLPVNRYNRDLAEYYSMTPDELDQAFGIRPPSRINSGLSVVRCASIDLEAVDRWLEHPKLFDDQWVTEQTLHALCSTVYGVELLPETYMVDIVPGLLPDAVCKHYPGYLRKYLYSEGMDTLARGGFLDALRAGARAKAPAESLTGA